MFCFVWCPCMAISVSVQHNGGFLPDVIILLTEFYYHRGTRLSTMKRFCLCSLWSHLNVLAFFPLTGGCSEGLNAFRFFFQHAVNSSNTIISAVLLIFQVNTDFLGCFGLRWRYLPGRPLRSSSNPYTVLYYTILYTVTQTFSSTYYVCVFFPFILDIKFVGRTSRGHTGGRSHILVDFSPTFFTVYPSPSSSSSSSSPLYCLRENISFDTLIRRSSRGHNSRKATQPSHCGTCLILLIFIAKRVQPSLPSSTLRSNFVYPRQISRSPRVGHCMS